jgi:hypothetical protein
MSGDPFVRLPDEVLIRIAAHLDARPLVALRRACRRWSEIAGDPSLWKALCARREDACAAYARRACDMRDWRAWYGLLHRAVSVSVVRCVLYDGEMLLPHLRRRALVLPSLPLAVALRGLAALLGCPPSRTNVLLLRSRPAAACDPSSVSACDLPDRTHDRLRRGLSKNERAALASGDLVDLTRLVGTRKGPMAVLDVPGLVRGARLVCLVRTGSSHGPSETPGN